MGAVEVGGGGGVEVGWGLRQGSHPSGRVYEAAAPQCSLDGEVVHAGFTYRLYCQLLSGLFLVFFYAARKTLPGVVGLLTCSFSREHQASS